MTIENNIIQISLFIMFLLSVWLLTRIDGYDSMIHSESIKSAEHMAGDCSCADSLDIDLYNDRPIYTPYHNCIAGSESNNMSETEELNEDLQHVHSMYNDYDKLLCCDTEFCENYTIIRKSDDYNDFPVDPYLNY